MLALFGIVIGIVCIIGAGLCYLAQKIADKLNGKIVDGIEIIDKKLDQQNKRSK